MIPTATCVSGGFTGVVSHVARMMQSDKGFQTSSSPNKTWRRGTNEGFNHPSGGSLVFHLFHLETH